MARRSLGLVVAGMVLALSAPLAGLARAATTPDASAGEAQEAATVEGYRSALFGMTESEVSKAIEKDFQLKGEQVKRSIHPIEKTPNLTVSLGEIIPESGPTAVGYIFGYHSKRLIQVNVHWGWPANLEPVAANLVATANILRRYFAARGYPGDRVIMNQPADDGSIVVFQAADGRDRTVRLKLSVPAAMGKLNLNAATGDIAFTESTGGVETGKSPPGAQFPWLRLWYMKNATAPDVFKVKEGQF